jgi:hypothetical protein
MDSTRYAERVLDKISGLGPNGLELSHFIDRNTKYYLRTMYWFPVK